MVKNAQEPDTRLIDVYVEIDSGKTFITALGEVEILLETAEAVSNEDGKSSVFNKAAILLLAGKFENFIESVAEDYIYSINQLRLNPDDIPSQLRIQHSFRMLRDFETYNAKHKYDKVVETLKAVSLLWATDQPFNSLDIDCKFSFGKHGDAEIQRLLGNIGIDNVFDAISISLPEFDTDGETPSSRIDFKGMFNSVTHMRNNILHEDATPSLTTQDVRRYKSAFQQFAHLLVILLQDNVSSFINQSNEAVS